MLTNMQSKITFEQVCEIVSLLDRLRQFEKGSCVQTLYYECQELRQKLVEKESGHEKRAK